MQKFDIDFYKKNDGSCPVIEFLKDGIFELRIKQGTDIVRVLYFFMIGHRIIITNGFVKKSQQTPRSEIELARKYKKEYVSGKEFWNE